MKISVFVTILISVMLSCFTSVAFAISYEELKMRLGHCGVPNSIRVQEVSWTNQSLETTYKYRLGEWGTRYTDTSGAKNKKDHVILMGGSNTFGESLHDNETISHNFVLKKAKSQVYNISYSGWGPSHHLTLFKFYDLEKNILPKNGTALFFLYPFHIERVVGSSCYFSWSQGNGPRFEVNDLNELQYMGSFSGQVLKTNLLIGISKIFQYLKIERCFPAINKQDAELTIRVLKEISHIYLKGNKKRKFFVVLPPRELRFPQFEDHYKWLLYYGKKYSLQFKTPAIKSKDNIMERFFQADWHLSPEGARIITDSVLTLLDENN